MFGDGEEDGEGREGTGECRGKEERKWENGEGRKRGNGRKVEKEGEMGERRGKEERIGEKKEERKK